MLLDSATAQQSEEALSAVTVKADSESEAVLSSEASEFPKPKLSEGLLQEDLSPASLPQEGLPLGACHRRASQLRAWQSGASECQTKPGAWRRL
jgi:hypothetical protein